LHDGPIDVSDFVIAVVDCVQWPDPGRYVAMDVQPESVRLCNTVGKPRRIEGAVEFDSGESIGFRFVDQFDCLRFARRDVRDLRSVGTLAVDE
jgi:hypothetical protein